MRPLNTETQIKNAPKGVHSIKGANGLYVKKETDTPGAGAYFVRYQLGPKKRPTMGLGPVNVVSLDSAREAAKAAVALARAGVDPVVERDRKKAANLAAKTFEQLTEAFRAVYTPTLKHMYADANWFNPIKKWAYPVIGKLPVNDITPDHIVAIMNAADAAGLRYTGYRLRPHLAAMFNTAIARRDRDPLRGNPCDAGLIAAFRPGKFKADDEHYARIELTGAPRAVGAPRDAGRPLTTLLWPLRWMLGCI
jgi:hypothetical protein